MKSLISLFRHLKPYWLPATLAPLFMVLEVAMDLAQPRLLQSIVDIGIANRDTAYVMRTGLTMISVAVVGLIGGVMCTVFAAYASLNFGASIRGKLFHKIQQLSFGNLDRLETGGLITRITNDIEQVQEAAAMFLRILIRAPLLTVGSLIMAVLTSVKLSVLMLVIGPILIIILILVNQKAHPLYSSVQERLDRVNTVAQENLAGVRVVKAFGRSSHESTRFGGAISELCDKTILASSFVAVTIPVMMLLINMGIVGVVWFGGVSVHVGDLKLGQLFAFINYLLQMLGSLMMVGMMLMQVARADASAERVIEVMESQPDVRDVPGAAAAPRLQGGVSFDRVSFSYGGAGTTEVLQDITFSVKPGQTAAVLGATGTGKSTLVHLIPRFYDVTQGRICLDGVDVREFTQESLRRQIAIVMQETILFSGTIKDNLRFGRPEASNAEIEEAARMAQAHDFVLGFAEGYDTVLGQRGVNLSGGQKQRLAIARALVSRPAILILDDCTSAVDMATEARILAELNAWSHTCTRFVVAQRIVSAIGADKIIVLDSGRIAAEGSHAELMQTSPIYQKIVQSQGGGRGVTRVP